MGMDLHGASGNYFHANVWSWRPIHGLVDQLNDKLNLNLDLTHWGTNDGAGLHTQGDCDALANAIESHVKDWPEGHLYEHEFAGALRVHDDGTFLKPGETGGRSAYSTDKEHILEFAQFLRECGGNFEIN